MVWFRMMRVALLLVWPYLLAPWRSPLLRWRMETYGVTDAAGRLLHADELTPGRMLAFTVQRSGALLRFLHWAALL